MNRQSNLINIDFFYINFIIFNYFYISAFACVSVFVSVTMLCIYVLTVASVLSAFLMYLVWLYFSKTIRVIHCFHPLKNPCKREDSLLGILLLESQISFSCN